MYHLVYITGTDVFPRETIDSADRRRCYRKKTVDIVIKLPPQHGLAYVAQAAPHCVECTSFATHTRLPGKRNTYSLFHAMRAAPHSYATACIYFFVEQRKTDFYTPLHLAVQRGLFEAARRLIELGADVNAVAKVTVRTPDGDTHHIFCWVAWVVRSGGGVHRSCKRYPWACHCKRRVNLQDAL